MRIFGIGPTEWLIILAILVIGLVPSVLAVIGMYRLSRKAGYDSGAATLWSVGFLVFGGLSVFAMGLVEWPRDRDSAQPAIEDPSARH